MLWLNVYYCFLIVILSLFQNTHTHRRSPQIQRIMEASFHSFSLHIFHCILTKARSEHTHTKTGIVFAFFCFCFSFNFFCSLFVFLRDRASLVIDYVKKRRRENLIFWKQKQRIDREKLKTELIYSNEEEKLSLS